MWIVGSQCRVALMAGDWVLPPSSCWSIIGSSECWRSNASSRAEALVGVAMGRREERSGVKRLLETLTAGVAPDLALGRTAMIDICSSSDNDV